MSDARRYAISIIENFSSKRLPEIALIIVESITHIRPEEFILKNTKTLDFGVEFLQTEDPFTWYSIAEDLAPAFRDFPDVCFCVSTTSVENMGDYRILFFNGKHSIQYPELRYPEFLYTDFDYNIT